MDTDELLAELIRCASTAMTLGGVTWFPVVCMPHRLRTLKTCPALKFTPNQAVRLL
ncbi:hypothetical protein [Streptomyces genisteinicus]|uniref:Uncharacterized protein n=1 Tax=Streptomyces genisteinicus TaxID=2768068 RepID=A0A7H0HUI0_9ACTN|nr:hypothetical protein [Streptomyces genisteinicus]QNP64196.1 hypothetical protein IAG43_15655 [Streptomyces genisteinicus]